MCPFHFVHIFSHLAKSKQYFPANISAQKPKVAASFSPKEHSRPPTASETIEQSQVARAWRQGHRLELECARVWAKCDAHCVVSDCVGAPTGRGGGNWSRPVWSLARVELA